MNDEPEPITALRSGMPISLDGIISKALAKEAKQRYQHIDEIPVDLENIDSRPSGISGVSTAVRGIQKKNRLGYTVPTISWLITLVALTLAFISVWLLYRPNPQPIKRWNISLPSSAPLVPVGSSPFAMGQPALAISPDGSRLAYVADIGNETQLYTRRMDEFEAVPIPGTEGAYHPFFSPDCQWIGFFANSKLKKVSVSGGNPIILCDVTNPTGASWGYEGQIVFAENEGFTLTLISEDGGETHKMAMKPWANWPKILPGGEVALTSTTFDGIKAVFLKSGEEKIILEGPYSNSIYLSTGHLLYERVGRLEVVPFDLDDLKVTGPSVSILDNIRIERRSGGVQCTISSDGTLIYVPGELQATGELVWLSRRGAEEALPFPAADYGSFQISPDGRQLAIEIRDAEHFNIWIYGLLGGISTKLTLEGNNLNPIWTNDGKWITFTSDRTGTYNLFMKKVDGTGEIKPLTDNTIKEKFHVASSWSPDDKILAFEEISTRGSDIYLLNMDKQDDKYQFAADPRFTEWGPAFSPDGKWIAYTSDEQGQYDIYVKPYPQTGKRFRISTDTGEEPVWSRSSKELYYRNVENGRRWMVVAYTIGSEFISQSPQVLFEGDYINVDWRSHDVSPDGQRFLLVKRVDKTQRYTQLNVITNWFEEVKRKISQDN
jgi:serine/threonine-protein kinase